MLKLITKQFLNHCNHQFFVFISTGLKVLRKSYHMNSTTVIQSDLTLHDMEKSEVPDYCKVLQFRGSFTPFVAPAPQVFLANIHSATVPPIVVVTNLQIQTAN